MNWLKFFIFVIAFPALGFVGWACSGKSSENPAAENSQAGTPTTTVFFTEKVKMGNDFYDSQLIQHKGSSGTSYWNLIKGKSLSRGTIIYSLPYTGMDWSTEEVDKRWAANASALTGYLGADIDGPLYNSSSSKPIFYQQIKKEVMPFFGLGLSLNGYDVLYVYHRFYAGRYADDYVQDVIDAVAWLKEKNASEEIALFGLSLGGFISSQAAARVKNTDLKAVGIISPLLSWPKQTTYLDSLNTLISDNTIRTGFVDFFEAYTRRFSNPESKLEIPQFAVPTLLIHDEWDTLVPISQAEQFQSLNTSNTLFIRHFHSTPIDFTTMVRDHSQPNSGMNAENIQPFYIAFMFNRVAANSDIKYIPYTQASMDKVFTEMHTQKQTGKDIVGFQNGLKEMCQNHFYMWDTSEAAAPETGPTYLARKLNQVWGLSENATSICSYLNNNAL